MSPVRTKQLPQSQKPKKQSDQTQTIAIIICVIVLIGAFIAAYFFYPPFGNLFKKQKEVVMVIDTLPQMPVDTLQHTIDSELVPHKTESNSSVEKGFYIIVGSFQQKQNAYNMANKHKKDVDLTVVYFEELGLYRVSAGRYDNIHKAYNDTYSIKDIDGCSDAWVLENQ